MNVFKKIKCLERGIKTKILPKKFYVYIFKLICIIYLNYIYDLINIIIMKFKDIYIFKKLV